MAEPTYRRISKLLRDEIQRGRWKPGDKLPSHVELAEQLKVSPTTARNAVLELVKENLLFTATSRGTIVRSQQLLDQVVTDFIRPDRPHSSVQDVFVETAKAAGREPSKTFTMGMEPASDQIATWLGVEPKSWVVTRTVMQFLDGEPWAWEVSYYPRALAEETGLDDTEDIPEGTTRRLKDRGHGETAWRDLIHARPASPEEAERLGIATGIDIQDYVRIGANHDEITRVTRKRSVASKNRVIHELGDDPGNAIIRAALNRANAKEDAQ